MTIAEMNGKIQGIFLGWAKHQIENLSDVYERESAILTIVADRLGLDRRGLWQLGSKTEIPEVAADLVNQFVAWAKSQGATTV